MESSGIKQGNGNGNVKLAHKIRFPPGIDTETRYCENYIIPRIKTVTVMVIKIRNSDPQMKQTVMNLAAMVIFYNRPVGGLQNYLC